MKLLIATNNKGKQQEFLKYFKNKNIEIVFPKDIGVLDEPQETGATFAENSLLKAKFYFEKTQIPSIADDAGIIIPILNNEPGIKSRRWLGYDASDKELIDYTLKRLEDFKTIQDRTAFFETVITYYDGKNIIQKNGRVEGYVDFKAHPLIIENYPYRSILVIKKANKHYNSLTEKEHEQYNHRVMALEKIWENIKDLEYNL